MIQVIILQASTLTGLHNHKTMIPSGVIKQKDSKR